MNNTDKERQKNTIKQMLLENKYDTSRLHKFIPTKNKKRQGKSKTKNKMDHIYIHWWRTKFII